MITAYKTIPEAFETLELQVKFLAEGHNPIVFFPQDTVRIPKLPPRMKALDRPEGIYYYNPIFIQPELIDKSREKDMTWWLLGFVQSKKEAIKAKTVIAVTVRSTNGKEIKSAVVDSANEDLLKMQAYIWGQWFPDCPITTETVFNVIAERLVDMGVING